MAELRLTVGDIAVTTESGTTTVTYGNNTYNVCLVDLSFLKKMYQPTEVKAQLDFEMSGTWVAPSRTDIENTFKLKNAILEVGTSGTDSSGKPSWTTEDTIGNDYYVHDVRVHYQSGWMFVYLTIYSLDKLLTLNKGCNTYVGKTLSSILTSVLASYKVPYNKDKSLSFKSGMQVLQIDTDQKDSDGNKVMKEHKFPYLVQYNESFYDLLKRTTNRWGEFLYWEDGTLMIGYDDSSSNKLDQSNFNALYYFDLEKNVNLELPSAGSYDYAAAYDVNVGNTPIKKNPYKVHGRFGMWNGQGDIYGFSVASRFFQNEENVTTWAIGLLADDLWDLCADISYVNSDNKDFNDLYFNGQSEDDQYGKKDTEVNLYTEYDSKYHKDTTYYSEILGYEAAAGKNAIRIKYDTYWPKLKLGDVVEVNKEEFIVVEVIAKAPKELRIKDNTKVVVSPGQTMTFEVVATAKISKAKSDKSDDSTNSDNSTSSDNSTNSTSSTETENKFYPVTLPTGHVRLSGPQVATIVDMDDPLKANRVRVVYDWQGDSTSTPASDYSPWLLYAAGSHGSPRGGRHLNGTKVLVGFVNGNIERPYVLGNIQEADTFVELKDVDLETPGKRKFQMWDHAGGVQKFVTGLVSPAVDMISAFSPAVDYWSWSDSDKNLAYAGGFKITDRLGLYNISGSTEEREVKIDSPWGEVKVNAFTGITISAPNGDVKIKGKNVEIEAGNNLKLTSGKNVGYNYICTQGEKISGSSILSDVCCKLIEKIGEKVQLVDLTFIRSALEVIFRPHEGCMTLKSNRYMKIETGTNECEYPVAAYSKIKKTVSDWELKSTLLSAITKKVPGSSVFDIAKLRSLITIIDKIPGVVTAWQDDYKKKYSELVKMKNSFDKAVTELKKYANDETAAVCKDYATLRDSLWDTTDTSDWAEDKLDFKDNVTVDGDPTANNVISQDCLRRNVVYVDPNDNLDTNNRKFVIAQRKQCRNALVKIANDMRTAIRNLSSFDLSKDDLSKQFTDRIGYYLPLPDDFITDLDNALKNDNCSDFAIVEKDTLKNLNDANINLGEDWKKYTSRLVVVKLLESLGFKDDMRRKINNGQVSVPEPDFSDSSRDGGSSLLNDAYWGKYVESLSALPAIKSSESSSLVGAVTSSIKDTVSGALSIDDIKGFAENFSWSDGKKGGVLFGYQGETYELRGKEIDKIETLGTSSKSISEFSDDIHDWDKRKLASFMVDLRKKLDDIK